MLTRFFLFIALISSPLAVQASSTLAEAPSAARVDSLVQPEQLDRALLRELVLEETNLRRVRAGRAPLQLMHALSEAAGDHALAMTDHGFFSHQNKFDRGQRTLSERVARVGLDPSFVAENIAMTFSVDFSDLRDWMRGGAEGARPGVGRHTYRTFARSVVQQWMDSRGHRANILNGSLRYIGLGFATIRDAKGLDRFYCVQDFYTPREELALNSRTSPGVNPRRVGLL